MHRFNNKKRLFAGALFLSFIVLTSTGCMRIYDDIKLNEDGTVTYTVKQCLNKDYMDELQSGSNSSSNNSSDNLDDMTIETLEDGQQYYTETETTNVTAKDITDNPLVTISKDIFYYGISQDPDETISTGYTLNDAIEQSVYIKMSVHLISDITETNANIKDETTGNTAVFDSTYTDNSWYAYTTHGRELIDGDSTPPVIKFVNKKKYYSRLPQLTFSDNVGLASVTVNGLPYTSKSLREGKNTVAATDIKGNTTKIQFNCDTKKPLIKGAKSGKTYKKKAVFYVKDKVSLSKVTINGKKKKLSKKNLVKKGKYKNYYKFTVTNTGYNSVYATDKAGNSAYIYFYIR